MDAAYHNALQRRSNLRKELEKIELFIRMYEELSEASPQSGLPDTGAQTENVTPSYPQEVSERQHGLWPEGGSESDDSKAKRASGNPKPRDVVDMAKLILRERRHPMTRSQVLAELRQRGLEIKGSNPSKVLGTNLWRARNEIVSLDGFGYWLKDEQYAPAGYFPDLADLV